MTLAALLVRSALVLLIAWGMATTLRRRGAATRHLAWTAGVTGAMALPALAPMLPTLTLPLPFEVTSRDGSIAPPTAQYPETMWEDADAVPVAEAPRTAPAEGQDVPWELLYGAVAATMLTPSLLSRIRLRRMAGRAREVGPLDPRRRLFDALTEPRRDRRLLESPACQSAIALGWRRGRVILPSVSRDWPEARLEAVLRHELAHLDRGDSGWRLVAEVARALHWIDPLAWLAARRVREESERACDDAVLRGGRDPSVYASDLVALSVERSWTWGAAGAFATSGALERRVEDVLDSRRSRRTAGPRARAAAGIGLLALLPLLAAAVPAPVPAAAPVGQALASDLVPVQVRWAEPAGIGGLALEGALDIDDPAHGEGPAFLLLIARGQDGVPRTLRSVRGSGGARTVTTQAGRATYLDSEWADRVLATAGRKLAGLGAEVRWRGAPVGRAGTDRRTPGLAGSVMTGLPATTEDGSAGTFLAGWRHDGRRGGLFLCGMPGVDPWDTVRRLRANGSGALGDGDCMVAWTWDPAAGSLRVLEAPGAHFTVDGARGPIDPDWLPEILASLEIPGS